MKIKKILNQHRRDFTAVYECESCDATFTAGGYDDAYFHENVVPTMSCKSCGEKAPENYRPLSTKYREDQTV